MIFKFSTCGRPGWRSGLAPPSAQGVILETRGRVPHRAPCMEPALKKKKKEEEEQGEEIQQPEEASSMQGARCGTRS